MSQVRRSSAARYGGEWVKAYAPLFAVAIVGFFALWAWVSFGPHTPTPKENWNQIESVWKPKRDADLEKVSAAVKAGDFSAEIAAYKALDDDTTGWMDALGKIENWGDPTATPLPGQTANGVGAMARLIAYGQTISKQLDAVITETTQNGILAHKETLLVEEQSFATNYDLARQILTGAAPASSSVPTLAFPAGTYVPPGSPNPSDSAGPSVSPSASPAPTATATPVPSPS